MFWTLCKTFAFSEVARGRTFDIPEAYLAFCGMVLDDRNNHGNVGCFLYSAGDGFFPTSWLKKSQGVTVI